MASYANKAKTAASKTYPKFEYVCLSKGQKEIDFEGKIAIWERTSKKTGKTYLGGWNGVEGEGALNLFVNPNKNQGMTVVFAQGDEKTVIHMEAYEKGFKVKDPDGDTHFLFQVKPKS